MLFATDWQPEPYSTAPYQPLTPPQSPTPALIVRHCEFLRYQAVHSVTLRQLLRGRRGQDYLQSGQE